MESIILPGSVAPLLRVALSVCSIVRCRASLTSSRMCGWSRVLRDKYSSGRAEFERSHPPSGAFREPRIRID